MGAAQQGNVNLIQVAGDEGSAGQTTPGEAGELHWLVIERLLDAWPLALGQALEGLWGLKVRITRSAVTLTRLGKMAENAPSGTLFGALETDCADDGLIVIEPTALFGILEFVLGNRDLKAPVVPDRAPTPFEAGVVRPLVKLVCDAFSGALSPAGSVRLQHRGWTSERGLPDAAALLATISVRFGESEGKIGLAIPFTVLAPISGSLGGVLHGRDLASAQTWRDALADDVAKAEVTVTALAFDGQVTLKRLSQLGQGRSLELDHAADGGAKLVVGGKMIGTGRMGKAGPNIAIKLDGAIAIGGNQ